MRVVIKGYLDEVKLATALHKIFSSDWRETQFTFGKTRHKWDVAVEINGQKTLVEYDGDAHYRDPLKIKRDRAKDRLALDAGFAVVRIPYWVQLDGVTCAHYFGTTADIEQSFPHGFITTKLFPASFCEMGLTRFQAELNSLPSAIYARVIRSLCERAHEHGLEYVLPSTLVHLVSGNDTGPLGNL